MKRRLALALAVCLNLAACEPKAPPADLVLRNGRIYTLDDERTWAEALAIDDGRIVFVGPNEGVDEFVGPETRFVDLEGKMALPGFHDSHVHAVAGGVELAQCDLNGLATREGLFAAIEECAARTPDEEWLVGGGWDLLLFPGASPDRSDLDRLSPDQPAYLSSYDSHSSWVNSLALDIAGIDATTPDPPNGRIERDPKTGEPTGTLRESASALVSKHLPRIGAEEYVEGLRRSLRMANEFGITSFIEADANARSVEEAYVALARSGELTGRVRVSLTVDASKDESQVEELLQRRTRCEAEGIRADAVKIYADGVIESGTAALLEPYVDFGHRGELNFTPEVLDRIVTRLDQEGFQIHVHAIGDRAIRASLDAFEKARSANGPRDSRHHIAHIQLFHPDDIPRFRSLGVVANFQPLWAFADAYITDLTEPQLGPERSRWLYPIKSLSDSGAVLAAGSDWPVSSMNPLDAVQVAVTRRDLNAPEGPSWIPEERVDLDTILAAYTRGGAYLQHQEALTGSLELGKRATHRPREELLRGSGDRDPSSEGSSHPPGWERGLPRLELPSQPRVQLRRIQGG
jgi:predicted amidohydrolase YtcJ